MAQAKLNYTATPFLWFREAFDFSDVGVMAPSAALRLSSGEVGKQLYDVSTVLQTLVVHTEAAAEVGQTPENPTRMLK